MKSDVCFQSRGDGGGWAGKGSHCGSGRAWRPPPAGGTPEAQWCPGFMTGRPPQVQPPGTGDQHTSALPAESEAPGGDGHLGRAVHEPCRDSDTGAVRCHQADWPGNLTPLQAWLQVPWLWACRVACDGSRCPISNSLSTHGLEHPPSCTDSVRARVLQSLRAPPAAAPRHCCATSVPKTRP